MKLSSDQEKAIQRIREPDLNPLFLTGEAGTGKSTVLSLIKNAKKVASTGIAAQLIEGVTLHRFLGMRPGQEYVNTQTFESRMQGFKYFILDEISMVGEKMFTLFMDAFYNKPRDVKLIFVGDFKQLPPVKDEPCYTSHWWERVETIELTEVHRQTENSFLEVLKTLRHEGCSNPAVKKFINSKSVNYPPQGVTLLASTRARVDAVNMKRLNTLLSDGRVFMDSPAKIEKKFTKLSDFEAQQEGMKNSRLPMLIRICKGLRVILLTNESTWCNGTTGEVESFNEDFITVLDDNGHTHQVGRTQMETLSGNGQALIEVTQFPMVTGFAITIHKSQGMSMSELCVDMRNHFEPAQTYVALSRATNPNKLTVIQ